MAVSHEAFLVHWPPFKDEIDTQIAALRARRVVENAADDWAAAGREPSGLLHGRQLAKAVVDTGGENYDEPARPTTRRMTSRNRLWTSPLVVAAS